MQNLVEPIAQEILRRFPNTLPGDQLAYARGMATAALDVIRGAKCQTSGCPSCSALVDDTELFACHRCGAQVCVECGVLDPEKPWTCRACARRAA